MKYLKYFLIFLVFTFTFTGLIQSVDARGADEPCSYLNPTKYVRDSGGNCVLASSGSTSGVTSTGVPQTGVSQARSTSEPCSYLSPTKYVRDSTGSCVLAPYIPVPQVVSQVVPATTVIPATLNPSGNLSDVAVIFLLGILAFIAYKIFGGRFRQPRIKYRPRQTPLQKPEHFVDNQNTAESNTTVQETPDTWNGGYYDDDTLEKFK
jgi:hypothetical protein